VYGCLFIIPDSPRIHQQKQDQQTHLHSGIRYSRKPSRASGPLTRMERQPSTRCRQTSRHSSPPCSSDCSAPSRHLEGITGTGTVTTCRPDDGALSSISCLPYGLVPLQGGSSYLVFEGEIPDFLILVERWQHRKLQNVECILFTGYLHAKNRKPIKTKLS